MPFKKLSKTQKDELSDIMVDITNEFDALLKRYPDESTPPRIGIDRAYSDFGNFVSEVLVDDESIDVALARWCEHPFSALHRENLTDHQFKIWSWISTRLVPCLDHA